MLLMEYPLGFGKGDMPVPFGCVVPRTTQPVPLRQSLLEPTTKPLPTPVKRRKKNGIGGEN
jgi:hypothetical protein